MHEDEEGIEDADTPTRTLIAEIENDPASDELVLEYLRSVADTDYRFTNRSLLDVARRLSDADRARRLALLDTLAEFLVLRMYLEPPSPVYVNAMKTSFAAARSLGGDAASWQDARAWLVANVSYANIPDDLWTKYAA